MVNAWRDEAACIGTDPETFFPVAPHGSHGKAARQHRAAINAALAICEGCPVADHCLAEAVEGGLQHGIWGGTTAEQRKFMRGTA